MNLQTRFKHQTDTEHKSSKNARQSIMLMFSSFFKSPYLISSIRLIGQKEILW